MNDQVPRGRSPVSAFRIPRPPKGGIQGGCTLWDLAFPFLIGAVVGLVLAFGL